MISRLLFRPRPCLVLPLLLFLLCACESEPRIPLPNGIPVDDIVYMPPTGDPVHTADPQNNKKTIGFINADGTNQVDFTFKIIGGAGSNFGVRLINQQAYYPRWAKSGNMLALAIANTSPNIRLIDSEGKMFGQKCDDISGATSFDIKGNILGVITEDSPAYSGYQSRITSDTSLVARYDLKTCSIVGIFSIPIPQNTRPWIISEAGNGLISAEYYEFSNDTNMIMIFNPKARDSTYFPGYYPSLSYDGTWVAYFDYSGDLVVRNTESSQARSIINVASADTSQFDYLYMPGWSPDSNWLVYNTPEGKIYRVNIETGENIYITDGWAPDWRP
jgi:hypothetical protein